MPERTLTVPLALWVCVCIGGSAFVAHRAWQDWRTANDIDHQNLVLAQRINELTAEADKRGQVVAPVAPYLPDARVIAKTASFPVQQALHALEVTRVDGIRLNSIDIHADQGSVELALEFSDYKTLLDYLESLNDGEPNARWKLRQATAASGAGQATIVAAW
ncbi:hypothetical protein SNE35_02450 [Paucibacter sp. R3-3]|uniref:Uncharacterized protein n=1 Tax=Roseateles agri TaxID=3098619 RepID=A0ABU5DAR5_9BURK|nr:hypothetical protein [Paucibacter sp. R3-3]MDY0743345.1 hypothetical protein [Paucibacter sp. R3-3]